MKLIAALFCMAILAMQCHESTWKQVQNSDYGKDSVFFETEDFYLTRQGRSIVITYEIGEYDPLCIARSLKGVTQITMHKVWVDSGWFDIEAVKKYFGEFTHRKMK